MDLHPDAEFALGMLRRESKLGWLLERLSRAHMRRADRCVVLGPGQERLLLEKGVAPERIETIPVWSDAEEIEPLAHRENPLRKALGFEGRFVVMYSGNAGLAHTFDEILAVAQICAKRRPEVLFAFVGGGPRTAALQAFVREHELPNVVFLRYFPRDQLRYSLTAADVHLVTLRSEFVGVAVPGKLYGILASGRPVLFVGPDESSSAATVRAARAGQTIANGDAAGLAAGLEELIGSAELRWDAGRSGRAYFLRVHERERCCEMWCATLASVLGEAPPPILADPRLTQARGSTSAAAAGNGS